MLYLDKKLNERQLAYRTVSVLLFAVAALTLVMRMIVRLFSGLPALATDAIFTISVQVVLFLALPFLLYKFVLGKNTGEIARFSSFNKIKWYYLVIAALIGFCVYVATIGISSIWQAIIRLTGYSPSFSYSVYPETFNAAIFLTEIVLTAVLPALCEEFLIRGGVLTVMRGSFRYVTMLWIMAAIFGLFHQNISQVFYTGCFGMLMAFLTLKLKSIFPAIIIHFVNNGLNVYMGYADAYGWKLGGGFFSAIDSGLANEPMRIFGLYVVIVMIGAALIVLMLYLKSKENLKKQKEIILDSGFDHTNNRVVMLGQENKRLVEDIGMQDIVYGKAYSPDALYKPKARDNAFLFGALAITVFSTIATFVWGFF